MLQPIDWIKILQKERDVEVSCIKGEIPVLITLLIPLVIGIVFIIVELRLQISNLCFPMLWLIAIIVIYLCCAIYPLILYFQARENIEKYNKLIQSILSDGKITPTNICKEYNEKFPIEKKIKKKNLE